MKTGQMGWTVPWAMWVDHEKKCWLESSFLVFPDQDNDYLMLIECKKQGFVADIARLPEGATWKSADKESSIQLYTNSIPVIEILEPCNIKAF